MLSNFRSMSPLASAPAPEHPKEAPTAHASSAPQAETTIIIDAHKPEEASEPDSEPKTFIEPKASSAEKSSTPYKGEPGRGDSE